MLITCDCKGEVIGALSIPIGNGAHTLKRASSIRMLHQTANAQRFSLYPLRRKVALTIFVT